MSHFEMETHTVPFMMGASTKISLKDLSMVPEAVASLLLEPRSAARNGISDMVIEDFVAALSDTTNERIASIHAATRSMLQQLRENANYAEDFHPYRDADAAIWAAEVVFNATYDKLRMRARRVLDREMPCFHQNAIDQATRSAVGQMSMKVSFWGAIQNTLEEEMTLLGSE